MAIEETKDELLGVIAAYRLALEIALSGHPHRDSMAARFEAAREQALAVLLNTGLPDASLAAFQRTLDEQIAALTRRTA